MTVTKLVVHYFDGVPSRTYKNWEDFDMFNAENISSVEETSVMALSEIKSRYKLIQPLKIEESDNIPCDAQGHEPKGSMGT